jgi:hypothetical protein
MHCAVGRLAGALRLAACRSDRRQKLAGERSNANLTRFGPIRLRVGGFQLSGTRQTSDGKRGFTLCAPRSPSLSKVTKDFGLGEEAAEIITPVVCDPSARYELVFAERGPIAGLGAGAARHHAGTKGRAADRITGVGAGAAARHVKGRGTSPASSGSRFAGITDRPVGGAVGPFRECVPVRAF